MVVRLDPGQSLLLVVDFQARFLAPILENGPNPQLLASALFLCRAAKVLGVPMLVSEQVPDKMGGTLPEILEATGGAPVFGKTSFGCTGDKPMMEAISETGRRQIILIGIETPICVAQTALGLLEKGFDVLVAEDAVSARDAAMHGLGMERMTAAGALATHTEAIVYEWMGSANHPEFKNVLQLVKQRNS